MSIPSNKFILIIRLTELRIVGSLISELQENGLNFKIFFKIYP